METTLDFIKKKEQSDLLNEGSVSLQIPQACRVIRLKLGAVRAGLKDTQAEHRAWRSPCSNQLQNTV